MTLPLITYLQDHLAGAQFAVGLLKDLSKQNTEVAEFSAKLLHEVESDRAVLEEFVTQIGGDTSALKEAAAWVSQKAGRLKLSLDEPFGVFEAIEVLSLGVLGKVALWTALQALSAADRRIASIDLANLTKRAEKQHEELESLRLKLATVLVQAEH
jgi:hypothetical protein